MKIFRLILLAILILLVLDGFYIVDETKQTIITQFGDPVGEAVTEAGIHIKIPFIHKVHYFEKRILEWDGDAKQIPTSDKKYLWVDTFARWRISDPLKFYQSMRNETYAHSRLDDILGGTTRDVLSVSDLIQVVKSTNREMNYALDLDESTKYEQPMIESGRETIQNSIEEMASPLIAEYGMELIDVKIKRVNYIEEVRRKVYDRMISERKKIAAKYRSEGQGKAAEIIGKMQRELDRIESGAYRTAQEIIGKADAEATRIYAESYGKDVNFYEFLQTLETYKKTINNKNTLIMSTDSDFYKYLKNSSNN